MLVKCINTGGYHLTLGKNYQVEVCSDVPSKINAGKQVFDYYVVNDLGVRHGVEKRLFISISDLREYRLKRLGI